MLATTIKENLASAIVPELPAFRDTLVLITT